MAQEDQKVQDLPDITTSSNDQHIMVITDTHNNQLRKEKIEDFIKDFVSADENNGLKAASDGKLYTVDTTNADNITSGVLDKNRLPDSGVEAKIYTFPEALEVDEKGRVKKVTNGTPGGNNADKDFSNISDAAKEVIRKNSSSDLPLFTSVAYDHILSGTDAIGWALQGSLITKVYPDAVTKIVELYTAGTDTEYRGIGCKRSTDGRYIADIAQKSAIDELFETSGIADFYILDGVNEQFYLPRTKWFNQFTLDTSLVNNFNEAGLPNIVGQFGGTSANTTGAFKKGAQNGALNTGIQFTLNAIDFDASASNPIYGNSNTVQPLSSNKLLYYKVGNTVINESTIDIGNVLAQLQMKADVDLANTTPAQSFKDFSIQWGMPDYSRTSTFTLPAAGSTFVVPYDCELFFTVHNRAGGTGLKAFDANGALITEIAANTASVLVATRVRLPKDLTVYVYSNNNSGACTITPLKGIQNA